MNWIIGLVLFVLVKVLLQVERDLNRDNYDLRNINLDKKFSIVVDMINDAVFNGEGVVTYLNKRIFYLYKDSHQIIFEYSTGMLTIIWQHQGVMNKKRFSNVRNVSLSAQQRIGELMIYEMGLTVFKHMINDEIKRRINNTRIR